MVAAVAVLNEEPVGRGSHRIVGVEGKRASTRRINFALPGNGAGAGAGGTAKC